MKNRFLILFIAPLFLCSCSAEKREGIDYEKWGAYWYQGEAEINAFDLKQYRYGEAREGEAVLIFVTEDLSKKKQVKLDNPQDAGRDAVKVLKLNMTKSFTTGIYPYNMMLSVFSPVYLASSALKLTASSQEWCGQSFTQLNLNGSSYKGRLYSYFEAEGDESFTISAIAEDHLWNVIRLDPKQLPLGEVDLIPGLLEQRFSHILPAAQKALLRVKQLDGRLDELEVDYVDYNRTLRIHYEREFPYQIVAFEEVRYLDNGAEEVTRGERKSVRQIDYWNKNKSEDLRLRKELQLNR
jgi:hypothetical protein